LERLRRIPEAAGVLVTGAQIVVTNGIVRRQADYGFELFGGFFVAAFRQSAATN